MFKVIFNVLPPGFIAYFQTNSAVLRSSLTIQGIWKIIIIHQLELLNDPKVWDTIWPSYIKFFTGWKLKLNSQVVYTYL